MQWGICSISPDNHDISRPCCLLYHHQLYPIVVYVLAVLAVLHKKCWPQNHLWVHTPSVRVFPAGHCQGGVFAFFVSLGLFDGRRCIVTGGMVWIRDERRGRHRRGLFGVTRLEQISGKQGEFHRIEIVMGRLGRAQQRLVRPVLLLFDKRQAEVQPGASVVIAKLQGAPRGGFRGGHIPGPPEGHRQIGVVFENAFGQRILG